MKVGDVVQLKSGGPDMTVEKVLPGEQFVLVWFKWGQVSRVILNGDTLSIAPHQEEV
jgi:uncharacterized protein YodC (DUF2158 family)